MQLFPNEKTWLRHVHGQTLPAKSGFVPEVRVLAVLEEQCLWAAILPNDPSSSKNAAAPHLVPLPEGALLKLQVFFSHAKPTRGGLKMRVENERSSSPTRRRPPTRTSCPPAPISATWPPSAPPWRRSAPAR